MVDSFQPLSASKINKKQQQHGVLSNDQYKLEMERRAQKHHRHKSLRPHPSRPSETRAHRLMGGRLSFGPGEKVATLRAATVF
ncbi:hypothetical protein OYC64_006988 [Pagothenia borchgrevinki]|uniref:Nuclear transcription factor Y subunit n=1 Tax=Pagothenia borchgrevinki TaxID=8213 RepID=A0ABD2G2V4_PAGBO